MSAIYGLSAYETFMDKAVILFSKEINSGRQAHFIWTLVGLLAVKPKENDFLYYERDGRKEKYDMKSRINGSYEWSEEVSFDALEGVMNSTYCALMDDLLRIERYGRTFNGYREAEQQWEKVSSRFTRELRFLIVGYCAGGFVMPLEIYHYLLVQPSFGNLIIRSSFDDDKRAWFDKMLESGKIVESEAIVDRYASKTRRIVNEVSFLGRFYLRMRANVMVRMTHASLMSDTSTSSGRLLASASKLRRVTLRRNSTISEMTVSEVDINLEDTQSEIDKTVGAAVALIQRTSILGSVDPEHAKRSHVIVNGVSQKGAERSNDNPPIDWNASMMILQINLILKYCE